MSFVTVLHEAPVFVIWLGCLLQIASRAFIIKKTLPEDCFVPLQFLPRFFILPCQWSANLQKSVWNSKCFGTLSFCNSSLKSLTKDRAKCMNFTFFFSILIILKKYFLWREILLLFWFYVQVLVSCVLARYPFLAIVLSSSQSACLFSAFHPLWFSLRPPSFPIHATIQKICGKLRNEEHFFNCRNTSRNTNLKICKCLSRFRCIFKVEYIPSSCEVWVCVFTPFLR